MDLKTEVEKFVMKGPEAVSYIHKCLKQDGWRGLGCLADFESKLRKLGFILRDEKNSRGQWRRAVHAPVSDSVKEGWC